MPPLYVQRWEGHRRHQLLQQPTEGQSTQQRVGVLMETRLQSKTRKEGDIDGLDITSPAPDWVGGVSDDTDRCDRRLSGEAGEMH